MHRKPIPLYGAPRGNRVMAAKRVHGPSANTILRMHVALEKCSVAGCLQTPILTKPDPIGKRRVCRDHIGRI
jgi:hypothetical protein